ncbi:MAG: redox-regulated ATPase YchF [Ignavibacteria bacterium]|nr:MAG: redox-regulated ATPase YchF [Ignavibacteria bacterium]
MQIGIVGLPFSGKSTLYQTITKTHLGPAALTKTEAHHAIVKVPDPRLDRLSALFSPQTTMQATIEFVDVVGLKKGESGSSLFANDAVPHPDGPVDPLRDIASFEPEFILSDLSIIETRLDRIRKMAQKTGDEQMKRELPVLEQCRRILESGKPLRAIEFSREDLHVLKTYQLLSIKPLLIALNFDESQRIAAEETGRLVAAKAGEKNTNVVSFFGKIEMEMSELPDEEAKAFMGEYGIKESALNTLIREAYALLGLQSFFTVGEDECRAWTIRTGLTAQEAAGAIHTDFIGKFIRAEVVHYDDFIAHGGSFPKVKEAGLWRLEGKEYVVKDGDIISIRHG